MSELDSKYIDEALNYKKKAKKSARIKWVAMSACLCLAILGAILPLNHNRTRQRQPDSEITLATENLDIYYVTDSETIESKNMNATCSPEDIFHEWAKLNHILDVTLVDCVYDNDGSVDVEEDENDSEEIISHSVGNGFTLTITLSSEFSKYTDGNKGELLMESLKQTFSHYNRVDEFNLVIAN